MISVIDNPILYSVTWPRTLRVIQTLMLYELWTYASEHWPLLQEVHVLIHHIPHHHPPRRMGGRGY